jgi:glucose-1-phosphate thymidylyltransferase
MKVIIPAAGIGSRLRPHTYSAPKALLHVAGKPILGHILDRVIDLPDLESVLLVTGFLGDQIQDYVDEHYRVNVRYVHQQELKGLGYAVHLATEFVDDDPILVVLGDTILETDFTHFLEPGKEVLGVQEVDDPRRFGIVEVEDGRITRLEEKPAEPSSNLAVVGIYGFTNTKLLKECLDEVVRREVTTRGEIQITSALQMMVDHGSVMVPHVVRGWYDCGKLETLLETNRHLLKSSKRHYEIADSVVIPPSYVSPSAKISRSVIGPYVSVGDHAHVIQSVIQNSIIGVAAEVKQCVMKSSMIGNAATVSGTFTHLNVGDFSEIG